MLAAACLICDCPMPTAEERAEMRALDAKLDAFAAMLKEKAKAKAIEG